MEVTKTGTTPARVAVVTGANKGIGFEICRQLALAGVQVVLTARDCKRGAGAVQKLKDAGVADVVFHQLDVADQASVASLADFVKDRWGKLDILVNNAAVNGVFIDYEVLGGAPTEDLLMQPHTEKAIKQTYEMAEECLRINYTGTRRITEALIPFLQLSKSPRIVNLSSYFGRLAFMPNEKLKQELSNVDTLTEDRLDELWQAYLKDVKENKCTENGWPEKAYRLSKILISAYTRILARKYPALCINCVDPGYVKTDITWNTGFLTTAEGAEGPVMLALLPDGSSSGFFYAKTEVSSFE